MIYSKPYLRIPQQIELLRARGMSVEDDDKAAEYLQRIGYYRLSAYWHPMRKRDGSQQVLDEFVEGTTFKEATDLYAFDSRLRLLMLDALERIEVSLRTEVALTLGRHDKKAHRDPNRLGPHFTKPKFKGGPTRHREWLAKLDERFRDSKDEFAEHFRTKYPNDDMPVWIAVELLDFGPLSHLINGMTFKDKATIGAGYGGIDPKHLSSWAHALSFTRNVCAHHSRLWNKRLINQPSLKGSSGIIPSGLAHLESAPGPGTRLYAVAAVCRYLLKHANPRTKWKDRFVAHIATFPKSPRLTLTSAGFPQAWQDELLWK